MDEINTSNQPSTGGSPVMNPMPESEHKTSAGPIIGSIIVVLVVVLGGLYLYGQQLGQKALEETPSEQVNSTSDQSLASLEAQGSTDDINEINADLNSSDLNNLDSDLKDVDAQLIY